MEIQHVLRQFITTNFYPGDSFVLTPEASLIDSGLIDSTGVLELITFLESEFAITIADAEVVPENLDSLARLTEFVAGKQAARAQSA